MVGLASGRLGLARGSGGCRVHLGLQGLVLVAESSGLGIGYSSSGGGERDFIGNLNGVI